MSFEEALGILKENGVLDFGPVRDGAYEAEFADGREILLTDATVGNREVSELDRLELLSRLMTLATSRGHHPATLMTIGLATALQQELPQAE